jgi:hypothetical protein
MIKPNGSVGPNHPHVRNTALAWLLGVSEDRPVEFVVGDRPRAAIKVA